MNICIPSKHTITATQALEASSSAELLVAYQRIRELEDELSRSRKTLASFMMTTAIDDATGYVESSVH